VKAVFGNFSLKAVALLISLGIWFYATQQVQDEMLVRAGVEVKPPPGYASLYQNVRDVQISLSGPRALISRLRDELAQAPLKLEHTARQEDLDDGWADLEVDESWLRVGLTERERVQINVAGVRPRRVRTFLSPRVERVLPVEFAGSVETAAGFTHEPAVCVPSQVTVGGPAAVLDNMKNMPTAELSFYDIRSDQQRSAALDTQRRLTLSSGEQIMVPLTTVPATVTVYVQVSGEPEGQRVFDGVAVLWQLPPGFAYTPEFLPGEGTVSVTVTGPAGALKRLDAGDVHAFVDLTRLARDQVEPGAPAKEPVQVYLPAGFEALSAKAVPAGVTLLLRNPVR
jgi:hypothetical protein